MTKKIISKTEQSTYDVCLILEGTYPYVLGGVSTWVHELITTQNQLQFCIVAILPANAKTNYHYKLPSNVQKIINVKLQELPKGKSKLGKRNQRLLFKQLKGPLLTMHSKNANWQGLKKIINLFQPYQKELGKNILLNSKSAWELLLEMYRFNFSDACFINYFWSWRALLSGLYSILFAPLPQAKVYHAVCTGYAGLYLARASIETNRTCFLTEHGIYTNERRIELASAEWLDDDFSMNMNIGESNKVQLRDFWMMSFYTYSKLCYERCEKIVTLYEENHSLQIEDGATLEKLMVIPNGIDYEKFSQIKKEETDNDIHTIALIGRVVPIKDIKTFINAIYFLRKSSPKIRAIMIGPTDEDEIYYKECKELVEHLKLHDIFKFTGKVDITKYLGKIDIMVLSSLSEAQPLVILEAGAAGVVSVATDVGSCREIVEGSLDEKPKLGQAGIICPLSDSKSIASAIEKLLTENWLYEEYSQAIKKRVKLYYNKKDQHRAYRLLYKQMIAKSEQA